MARTEKKEKHIEKNEGQVKYVQSVQSYFLDKRKIGLATH